MTRSSPSRQARWGPSTSLSRMLGSPMSRTLRAAAVTRIRRAVPGEAAGGPAGGGRLFESGGRLVGRHTPLRHCLQYVTVYRSHAENYKPELVIWQERLAIF